MSRIEDAWKVQRSLERGEPQPTAMTTNMTPEQEEELSACRKELEEMKEVQKLREEITGLRDGNSLTWRKMHESAVEFQADLQDKLSALRASNAQMMEALMQVSAQTVFDQDGTLHDVVAKALHPESASTWLADKLAAERQAGRDEVMKELSEMDPVWYMYRDGFGYWRNFNEAEAGQMVKRGDSWAAFDKMIRRPTYKKG